ncbi:DUF58 domain-containing protein [Lysinibacillus sp. KU-BSD001]|uniref:DUF58 domain-containing protein n=1 Tax=Lysinibacillus sp. KU-BSD001 TaxID=3141328 RepID=UPI0036E12E3E
MKAAVKMMRQTGRFFTVIGLLVFTFCFAMFQGGFVSWFIFFTVLPFLLYSLVLAVIPLRIDNVTRDITPATRERGDTATITVRFDNKSLFPFVFLVIRELDMDERFYHIAGGRSSNLFLVGWKRHFEWTYELENLQRGEHMFSALELTVTDFFGWVVRKKVIEQPDRLLVYPKTVDMPYTSLQMQYDQGAVATKYAIVKDTTMVTGVRDYQPGDRFSWIHWKSFAKNGELRTKEFEDRQSQSLFLYMDCATTQHFEEMVELTASMLKAIVKRHGDVAFLSEAERCIFYPAVRTEAQFENVMQHLAKVTPNAESSIDMLLRNERQLSNSILLFVTGHITDELKTFLMNSSKYARAVVCFVVVSTEQYKAQKGAAPRFMNAKVVYVTKEMFNHAFAEVNKP